MSGLSNKSTHYPLKQSLSYRNVCHGLDVVLKRTYGTQCVKVVVKSNCNFLRYLYNYWQSLKAPAGKEINTKDAPFLNVCNSKRILFSTVVELLRVITKRL